ncbi:hypothetical protein DMUE_2360 [Dictyocoela muelleri]|nr:hypothetical protein DMUE_2360 [Dictyocoela muelleri]
MSTFQKEYLIKSKIWLIDGTFKSCPFGFYRILTIQGFFFCKAFPLCFILLESKDQQAYCEALEKLKTFGNFNPECVIMDFEKALVNSIKKIFPCSITYGCQFNFGQSLFRLLKDSCRLGRIYNDNVSIRNLFRSVLNLAFFPTDNCLEEYKNIKEDAKFLNEHDKMEQFFDYFERTYIGRFIDRKFISPQYSIEFWSCYKRVLFHIPRTTNSVESLHSLLNRRSFIPTRIRHNLSICFKMPKMVVVIV